MKVDTQDQSLSLIAQRQAALLGFLDSFGDRIFSSPVYGGGHIITFHGLGSERFEGKNFMDCVGKAYDAWSGSGTWQGNSVVRIMRHYEIHTLRGIDEVRALFKDTDTDWTMNWLFLSTSGVHGTYTNLNHLEEEWEEQEEGEYHHSITALLVFPRLVLVKYGHIEIEREDIWWLRNAVTKTLEGVSESQYGNIIVS